MTFTSPSAEFYGATYNGNATENYERYFVPAIGRPLAEALVEEAKPGAGDRVLDVGCGTGIVTRLAAERVGPAGSVAGADINAGMLAVARSVVRSPSGTPIRWYETAAEAMPLPDAAFDLVLCQLALQFFADKAAAVREMHRVVSSGGRVFASVPAPTAFFEVFEQGVTRHAGPAIGAFVRQVFSLNDERQLDHLFAEAGFRHVTVRTDARHVRLPAARDFMWQYVYCTPLAGPIGELTDEARAALERDVVSGWEGWAVDGGLRYAQPVLTVAARK
jgi:ubiquinone/menaquinone biosynthesis C-methylase UbiE